jgi:hypothetical protein
MNKHDVKSRGNGPAIAPLTAGFAAVVLGLAMNAPVAVAIASINIAIVLGIWVHVK